jgi:hypothetical protein
VQQRDLEQRLSKFHEAFRTALFRANGSSLLSEVANLAHYGKATLNLTPQQAFGYVRQDCVQLINRTFAMAKNDGLITPAEERLLLQLQQSLCLSPRDLAHVTRELESLKLIQAIRSGNIPSVPPTVTLPSSEVCHWDSPATYHRELKTQTRLLCGQIILTNRKLRFVSVQGGFEFPVTKVASARYRAPGGVQLQLTRQQGNGYYEVARADLLCEIFHALLKHAHRQEVLLQEGSRHIAQEVKAAVWRRDQGRCVQCGASDYLEYDHIIPFSRGGASSTNNVQLLCRRCNLAKSDAI